MSITLLHYFANQAAEINANAFNNIDTLEDWERSRIRLRKQFLRSLGFEALPEIADLDVTEHNSIRGDGFFARHVSFRIMPDCFGSGMIFYPDPLPQKKNPGVLYLCGHANFGVLDYHPHAIMWARKGYVCLILDTIQQADNTGEHAWLGRRNRTELISMGYTPAGGEFLNDLRGLDVLCSLPEVDETRIGTTGLSGGGAHSFFLGIADERISAVATACGAVNLKYTVKNRNFNSNCDCMFYYNLYQRDTSEFGALIAPRPLLFCHARGDYLFTPEENINLYENIRKIYRLYGCEENCKILHYDGPHSYQAEGVKEINRWFDVHVARSEMAETDLGDKVLSERQCTIFNGAFPVPDRLDILPELLTPPRSFPIPDSLEELEDLKKRVVETLEERVFNYVVTSSEKLEVEQIHEWKLGREDGGARTIKYRGDIGGMEIWITRHIPEGGASDVLFYVCNTNEYEQNVMATLPRPSKSVEIYILEPRAGGLNSYNQALSTELLTAGMYIGLTPVVMWIKDLREVFAHFHKNGELAGKNIYLYGTRDSGIAALYHTLFDEKIKGVMIGDIFYSHKVGGHIPAIMKVLDIEQAIGLVAPRIIGLDTFEWHFVFWAARVYERLGILDRFVHTHSMASTLERVFT